MRSPSCSTRQRHLLPPRTRQEIGLLYCLFVLGLNWTSLRRIYACSRIFLEVSDLIPTFCPHPSDKSFRLYFYVEFAFACALLILAFIFVEESAYKRVVVVTPTPDSDNEKGHTEHVEVIPLAPPRRSWLQTLKPWSGIDHEAEFFMTMLRSFSYFLVPSVLWVVTSFGKSTFFSHCFHKANKSRHLHRSRRPNIQLHFPHQNRRTTL
jgi:hypothetical protein